MTRTRHETGEAFLVPGRNGWSKVGRITGDTGKSAQDERVAAGSVVALKSRVTSVEPRDPTVCNVSFNTGGKGEMIKAPISLQDLRQRLYAKAKAEESWRFWGLFVHVYKMETLYAAYAMAKENHGAPGIDGTTFEAIEAAGVDAFLEQIQEELVQGTYRPRRYRRQAIPKDGGRGERILSIPCIRARVVQGALKLILSRLKWLHCNGQFGKRVSSNEVRSRP